MNRRIVIGAVAAGAVLPLLDRAAGAQTSPKTKNAVFVHGLFADGSCWSKVIARLQQKGVNCAGGAVRELVGIESGVVSGVINLE